MAGLVEADSGFPIAVEPRWSEFTEHCVTERHRPEHCRTLRALVHRDDRQDTHVAPGDGRFLFCDQPDLLTIFLHLPVINNESENEVAG